MEWSWRTLTLKKRKALPTHSLFGLLAFWLERLARNRPLAADPFTVTWQTYRWLLEVSAESLIAGEAAEERITTKKTVAAATDLLPPPLRVRLTDGQRPATFDLKLKNDSPYARELRSVLSTGAVARSLLSASKDVLALAEGDKVHLLDISADAPADRATLRAMSKTAVGFEVLSVSFNPATLDRLDGPQLLVSGFKDCMALTLGRRGEVASRLTVDLLLEDSFPAQGVHILRTMWTGHRAEIAVLTNNACKIYDLRKDKL